MKHLRLMFTVLVCMSILGCATTAEERLKAKHGESGARQHPIPEHASR